MWRKGLVVLLLAALAAALWAGAASAHSGAGMVVAMKNGDFKVRYFNGTQAGLDSAIAYCTPGGFVTVGPGMEAINPSVTVPTNVWVVRNGNAGWNLRGNSATATVPRFGPASTPTTGDAIRFVDGVTFPFTVAGVQAAIDECAAVGSGEVWIPSNANILLATTPVKLKNKVKLRGATAYTGAGYTFTSNASTNVAAAIINNDTTGAQQYAAVEGISIYGGAAGARIDAGIKFKLVFVGTYIRDVLVDGVSGVGIRIEGDNAGSAGQLLVENAVVGNTGHYGYYLNASLRSIWLENCTAERPGRNSAGLFINGQTTTAGANIGVRVSGFYTEVQDSMSPGIMVDGAAAVEIDNYTASIPTGRMRAAVLVKNTNAGNFGFSPSGLTIRNLYAESDTLIENQYTGEIVTTGADVNNPYRHVHWYSSAIAKGTVSTNGYRNSGMVIGVQQAKKGPDIASAATIAPHPDGSDFTVTGTTTTNTITGLAYFLWKTTCFWTTAAWTLTSAGNVKTNAAAGNFVGNGTGAADCWCGKWDGTNWLETSRSLN